MMSAAKRKPAPMKTKPKEEVNKKAIIWTVSLAAVLIVIIALLLILS
ncbi:hypothetical protein [Paenibacillus yanchengensis]|uniref:Uncharacterized protein n=1 Tax=Paenibacillus yanchengensis TaxID=2035833 RepID=A0ABW4YP48_9BACL